MKRFGGSGGGEKFWFIDDFVHTFLTPTLRLTQGNPSSLWHDSILAAFRACLHGGGGPQVGEVTRFGG